MCFMLGIFFYTDSNFLKFSEISEETLLKFLKFLIRITPECFIVLPARTVTLIELIKGAILERKQILDTLLYTDITLN